MTGEGCHFLLVTVRSQAAGLHDKNLTGRWDRRNDLFGDSPARSLGGTGLLPIQRNPEGELELSCHCRQPLGGVSIYW